MDVERETKFRRLMIAKVELENFKSYFGTKVIGPLHKNFTAVVGPNGSGKSNLIESLLFVFGKRAKQMRLNKLAELIHKSAEHPNCLNASVRVSFQEIYDQEDDPDYYQVIPGTQFTVARQVNKTSQSKYCGRLWRGVQIAERQGYRFGSQQILNLVG